MEQSTQSHSLIPLFLCALAAVWIVSIGTEILVYEVLGVPSTYARPINVFMVMLAIYPFLRRFPVRSRRKPLTFRRWVFVAAIGTALIPVSDYLIDRFLLAH